MKVLFFVVGVLCATTTFGAGSRGQDVREDIVNLTSEIREMVFSQNLVPEQLTNLQKDLQAAIIRVGTYSDARLICMKNSNGLFYPTNSKTGQVVGASGFQAGQELTECKKTLPDTYQMVACFKSSNGLFYPTNPETGAVIGSSGYQAGHDNLTDCKATLPHRNESPVCYKSSNGLYYPSNSMTGDVIGSSGYQAGSSDFASCKAIIGR